MQGFRNRYLWVGISFAVVIIVLLIFWLKPEQARSSTQIISPPHANLPTALTDSVIAAPYSASAFSSHSQSDTQINCQIQLDGQNSLIVNEHTRDCFEYFITQYGEKSMTQIDTNFKAYLLQNYQEPALSQIQDLWTRYLKYREKLGHLQAPDIDQQDPQYYQSIFANMKNLRQQIFSNAEIDGLFGTEDLYHQYTLNRMAVLADSHLTEAQKAQKLKDLFNQLPEDWKENLEQLNKLEDLRKLTADIRARGGSAEDLHQMRLNLVGVEATQRLETLDVQRKDWKDKINQYLSERDSIINSGLSDEAKQQAVQKLRTQHFQQPEEQLRAGTFETIHDQGGKLPYSE